MARKDPFIGNRIKDYLITKRIGGGTFGAVYRVDHARLNKAFALKILHPHISTDEHVTKRFCREAEALALVDHPNVVQIIDFDQDDTHGFYLVMELLDGQPLNRILKKHHLPHDLTLKLFIQLLAGLEEVHRQGIIHRDLKPSNLMIGKAGDEVILKLFDFGIAFVDQSFDLTKTGTMMGSARYMSPEQVKGLIREIDVRSDLYSCGIILGKMLTGQDVFTGDLAHEIYMKHIHEMPPRLQALDPTGYYTEEIEQIFARSIAKEREHRFQTAGEFLWALKQAQHNMSHTGSFSGYTEGELLEDIPTLAGQVFVEDDPSEQTLSEEIEGTSEEFSGAKQLNANGVLGSPSHVEDSNPQGFSHIHSGQSHYSSGAYNVAGNGFQSQSPQNYADISAESSQANYVDEFDDEDEEGPKTQIVPVGNLLENLQHGQPPANPFQNALKIPVTQHKSSPPSNPVTSGILQGKPNILNPRTGTPTPTTSKPDTFISPQIAQQVAHQKSSAASALQSKPDTFISPHVAQQVAAQRAHPGATPRPIPQQPDTFISPHVAQQVASQSNLPGIQQPDQRSTEIALKAPKMEDLELALNSSNDLVGESTSRALPDLHIPTTIPSEDALSSTGGESEVQLVYEIDEDDDDRTSAEHHPNQLLMEMMNKKKQQEDNDGDEEQTSYQAIPLSPSSFGKSSPGEATTTHEEGDDDSTQRSIPKLPMAARAPKKRRKRPHAITRSLNQGPKHSLEQIEKVKSPPIVRATGEARHSLEQVERIKTHRKSNDLASSYAKPTASGSYAVATGQSSSRLPAAGSYATASGSFSSASGASSDSSLDAIMSIPAAPTVPGSTPLDLSGRSSAQDSGKFYGMALGSLKPSRDTEEPPPPKKSGGKVFFFLFLLLVLGAVGAGGWFWLQNNQTPQTKKVPVKKAKIKKGVVPKQPSPADDEENRLKEILKKKNAVAAQVQKTCFSKHKSRPLEGNLGNVHQFVISKSKRVVLSVSTQSKLRVWALAEQKLFKTVALPAPALSIALSEENGYVVVGLKTGQMLFYRYGDFLNQGKKAKKKRRRRRRKRRRRRRRKRKRKGLVVYKIKAHKDSILSLAFSPDGKQLASASADHTIKIWKLKKKPKLKKTIDGHDQAVNVAFYSKNGKHLFTASTDKSIAIWKAGKYSLIRRLKAPAPITAMAMHPSKKHLLTGTSQGFLSYWDLGQLAALQKTIPQAHLKQINSISFSEDGKEFITSSDDKSVSVWKTKGLKVREKIMEITSPIYSARFTQPNHILASSSENAFYAWTCPKPSQQPK